MDLCRMSAGSRIFIGIVFAKNQNVDIKTG
jgi:hypothetical protein